MKLCKFLVIFLFCTSVFSSSVQAEVIMYMSLYYADPSWATVNDRILLTDGRTISIKKKNKLDPPKAQIRTDWAKFNESLYAPPESNLELQVKTVENKTNVCLSQQCAVIQSICPRVQLLRQEGTKCVSLPSLADLISEK